MIKLGICNELFEHMSFGHVCGVVKRLGYDGIELAPYTIVAPNATAKLVTAIAPPTRELLRKTADKYGLEIIGLHWVLAQTEGLHVSHPDDAVRQRTTEYMVELVRFCHDLGGKIIVFGSPKQRDLLEGVSLDEAWSRWQETFRPAARVANECGVTICMEPLARSISNIMNRAEAAVRFAQEMNEPSVKIILDCYSMGDEATPRADLIRQHAQWLAHVHANDVNEQGPGMAEHGTDFAVVFEALKEIGYDGYVSVESFDFTPGAEATARRSMECLRACR